MPANITRRVEAHESLPYLAVAAVALIGLGLLPFHEGGWSVATLRILCIFFLYVGISLLGVLPISIEWANGTMPRLLAQPVTRGGLWYRKLLATALPLGLVLLVGSIPAFGTYVRTGRVDSGLEVLGWVGAAVLNALVTGPFMAVHLRQTLIAVLATMIVPFAIVLLGALVLQWTTPGGAVPPVHTAVLGIALGWAVAAHLLARRAFLRLEV